MFHYHSQTKENIFLETDASHFGVDFPCMLNEALPCTRGDRNFLQGPAVGLAALEASAGTPTWPPLFSTLWCGKDSFLDKAPNWGHSKLLQPWGC